MFLRFIKLFKLLRQSPDPANTSEVGTGDVAAGTGAAVAGTGVALGTGTGVGGTGVGVALASITSLYRQLRVWRPALPSTDKPRARC